MIDPNGIKHYRWLQRQKSSGVEDHETKWLPTSSHVNESIEKVWREYLEGKQDQSFYSFMDGQGFDFEHMVTVNASHTLEPGKTLPPIWELKRIEEQILYQWCWWDNQSSNPADHKWKNVGILENIEIEEEWQEEKKGHRFGQRPYHCFGDQSSVNIDFYHMQTYSLAYPSRFDLDPMSFKLERLEAGDNSKIIMPSLDGASCIIL